MKINKELLKSFKPCADRWENYLKYYSNFEGSFDEFIDLENVSYSDKIWVSKHVLNKNQLCHFGLLCAESVLSIFEDKYPEDKRVGDCIRYLMKIDNFDNVTPKQRKEIIGHRAAAAAAAYAAYAAYAYAAYAAYAADAYAAAGDAAAAAYAAADAAADAAYAAYAYAAYAYADDASAAARRKSLAESARLVRTVITWDAIEAKIGGAR